MKPCEQDIFEKGEPVAALDAAAKDAEKWVKAIAKETGARVDWHYSGGVAQVLYLGDKKGREKVENAIDKLAKSLHGHILTRFKPGYQGLYRNGVTEIPENTIAAFFDPVAKKQKYIIEDKQ